MSDTVCLCVVAHRPLFFIGVCDGFVFASRLLLCYCFVDCGGGMRVPPSGLCAQAVVVRVHTSVMTSDPLTTLRWVDITHFLLL